MRQSMERIFRIWEERSVYDKPFMVELFTILRKCYRAAWRHLATKLVLVLLRRLDGDIKDMGLRPGMAMDREKWRCGIMRRTSDLHKRVVVVVVVVLLL